MQELFLHYIWDLQYFDKRALVTTEGDSVDVFHPGTPNHHAGPDFSNARLRLGDMDWVGHVEIHTKSSGWLDHRHDQDAAYDSVILHVVWREDKPILRRDGTRLPTVELQGRIEEVLIQNYRQLVGSGFSIPCERSLRDVPEVVREGMVTKALVQRLERKATEVLALLQHNRNNWEETSYQFLAKAFGFKVNAEPMLQLARALPLRLVHRQDDLFQTEALLFGQAGFLETTEGDAHYKALQKEYRLKAHAHGLSKRRMSKAVWKFLRMRPPNFPTVRLAQWCAVLHHQRNLHAAVLDAENRHVLIEIFRVPSSSYWTDHYQFSKKAGSTLHELGIGSAEGIVVNAVVPLWAAFAMRMDDQRYMDRALAILEELPAEENAITKKWTDLGMSARNSSESQGLIELFNTFCQRKNCLQCSVGTSLIRPHDHEPDYSSS